MIKLKYTQKACDEIDHLKVRNDDWRYRRVQIGSMYAFFRYAESQVIDYGEEYENLKNKYLPTRCVSCAIAAYAHMKSSIRFAERAANHISFDISQYKPWIDCLTRKRNRISGHPDVYREENSTNDIKSISVHHTIISGKDKILFQLWDQYLESVEDRKEFLLTPAKDLDELAMLLESVSESMLVEYRSELAGMSKQ